jgi:hypothetical protein
MPIFKLLFTRPKRLADFCAGGGAALGGMALSKIQRTSSRILFIATLHRADASGARGQ